MKNPRFYRGVPFCRQGTAAGTGDPSPTGRHGRRQMRARCGGGRYFPDPLGSVHCTDRGERDGRPVPYGGVRSCTIASKEFVGEAFRLPGRHSRRHMRAGCGGGRYFPDPLGDVPMCQSRKTGRETRPLREGRGCVRYPPPGAPLRLKMDDCRGQSHH